MKLKRLLNKYNGQLTVFKKALRDDHSFDRVGTFYHEEKDKTIVRHEYEHGLYISTIDPVDLRELLDSRVIRWHFTNYGALVVWVQ